MDSDESWDSMELMNREQDHSDKNPLPLLQKPLDLAKIVAQLSQRRCKNRVSSIVAARADEDIIHRGHPEDDFDDIGFEGHCGNLALRLSGRREKESEQVSKRFWRPVLTVNQSNSWPHVHSGRAASRSRCSLTGSE